MESHSSRRLTGMFVTGALAVAVALGIAKAAQGPPGQSGTFALLGGTPKIASKFWVEPGAASSATLKIQQFQLTGGAPILRYDVEMQKLIHLIIVRDDFGTFAHVHPAFSGATGTFSETFTTSPNHRYYAYVDTTPRGIGQQVFRFTLDSTGPPATPGPMPSVFLPSVVAGPYRVTLDRTQLAANQAQTLELTVFQGRRLAADLRTYLGAAAHAVFINTSTLVYVHVHPMVLGSRDMDTAGSMASMSRAAGPRMQMKLPPLPAGTYRLWVQFRGREGEVFIAPFTLLAQ
ncbi:MAG: hypothetical protein WB757_07235 [Candidatus Cybelea sp.]